jgi:hypothetical protein
MTPLDDYRHIREQAAIGAIAPRHQIAVAGPDHATYLQGLLTNDIPALTPGTGCYSAWLTPQGRMLTDMHVLESGGMILLDLPAETTEATRERLDQFIFTENVQVESLADSLAGVWVHGPKGAEVLERTLGLPESAGRSDQPSLASGELRRSAAALAKAEGGHYGCASDASTMRCASLTISSRWARLLKLSA